MLSQRCVSCSSCLCSFEDYYRILFRAVYRTYVASLNVPKWSGVRGSLIVATKRYPARLLSVL
jgi:hypothetical protein